MDVYKADSLVARVVDYKLTIIAGIFTYWHRLRSLSIKY